ncbi:MAG TPA: TonB-dependent receptor [Terriglobia bacterium]|nr:TonB-dependent receptor [Terriglobia bacterium]
MLHPCVMPGLHFFDGNHKPRRLRVFLSFATAFCLTLCFQSQAATGSFAGGTVQGTVVDPSGAAVKGATVQIENPITAYREQATTDASGNFQFINIPFNPYHLTVTAGGFQSTHQDVTVRTPVPVMLKIALQISTVATTVTVTGEPSDLIENTPLVHTDVSRSLISKLPVANQNIGLSTAITLATPGIVADSNGMFHPLGEHDDTTITIDGQPDSDQISQIYSNQIPLDVIQSMQVVNGVAPAEDGDKSSLVVNTQTRSGLGLTKPRGEFDAGYGSFGTWFQNFTLGMGGNKWGNFLAANTSGTSRFMDSPELTSMHDKGNNENFFDRADYNPDNKDTLHMDIFAARTWFQAPNTYPQQFLGQDQRQEMYTLDLSPAWVRTLRPDMLLSVNPYFRQDYVRYYPSRNVFQDTPATVAEARRLQNIGLSASIDYARGIHTAKFGIMISQTPLNENFSFGLTDPTFNPVCLTGTGAAVTTPTIINTSQCAPAGYAPNPGLLPGLVPYDLSRGGVPFSFRGHADIREEAVYAQDSMQLGQFTLNAGLRGDFYNGITSANGIEPRVGVSYAVKRTSTVFSASYGRFLETPYNENLILSSETGAGGLASNVGAFGHAPLRPGYRNLYDISAQQALGRWASVDVEQFWKFSGPDFDFDTLFNTPIIFPIEWAKSKIEGFTATVNFPSYHGLTAYMSLGHVEARFFPPETGGILFNSPLNTGVFRIDHDEDFDQTTQIRYQYNKKVPWLAFTWRYDSGLVAGTVLDYANALTFSPDNQMAMGLYCGNVFATLSNPLTSCNSPVFGATRITLPAPGTYNPDHNPTRVAPRNVFDLSAGKDALFQNERLRVSLMFTVTNVTNQDSLYNFLSTFSGTHFIEPRAYQAQLGFHF